MAKVTYTGQMEGFSHHGNPTCTDYTFQRGCPVEVKPEDAEHYTREGGPWKVDFGIAEKTVRAVKTVMPKEEKTPPKGKKGRR